MIQIFDLDGKVIGEHVESLYSEETIAVMDGDRIRYFQRTPDTIELGLPDGWNEIKIDVLNIKLR